MTDPEQLLEQYADGERDFSDSDISDTKDLFVGVNLSNSDFSGSFIVADFENAILKGVVFNGSNVKTCNFKNANLENASFIGAAIDAAIFEGANMQGCNFHNASAQGYLYTKGEVP